MKIEVEIEGIRPLLQNRFPEEGYEAASRTKKQVGVHPKDDPKQKLYMLTDGTVYQPAEHLLRSMTKAAVNYKIGGRGRKTYKDIILSSVFITPEAIPHKIQKWVTDERSVVIKATRGRIIRRRPKFEKWNLAFTLDVQEEQIDAETIKRILDYAGQYVGIGDYRPRFGLFMVTRFEEIE